MDMLSARKSARNFAHGTKIYPIIFQSRHP